jgi:hypothetical protein
LKIRRLFSIILGVILISACSFFLLLFVGIALEFGFLRAWLYAMPLCLGIFVGFQLIIGKSLRDGVKNWLGFVVLMLIPFVAFIVFLPTVYQILSIILIPLAFALGVYAYRKRR